MVQVDLEIYADIDCYRVFVINSSTLYWLLVIYDVNKLLIFNCKTTFYKKKIVSRNIFSTFAANLLRIENI